MSTPPRRRRPVPPNSTSAGSGWFPTLAMGLGVIVAGLGIGALVAVFMQRSALKPDAGSTPVAVVTSTAGPSDRFTRPPIAIATIEPPRTPRPTPAPTPTPDDSPSTTPTGRPTPSPLPSAPTGAPSVGPTVNPARMADVRPTPTAPSADTPEPTEPPATTPVPTPLAVATAAPPVSSAGPTSYEEHAAAIVRRYVDALIRGDERTAYSALGGSGGTLAEQSFLDPSARIVSVKVTRIDASNASVGCEILSAKGRYYATYHVTAATTGPYISEHDYIKV